MTCRCSGWTAVDLATAIWAVAASRNSPTAANLNTPDRMEYFARLPAVAALFADEGTEGNEAELAGPATATGGIPAPKETEHRTPQGTQGTEPATSVPPSVSGERPDPENDPAIASALLSMEDYVLVHRDALARLSRAARRLRAQLDALRAENDHLSENILDELAAERDQLRGRLRAYEQVLRDHDNTATPDVMSGLLDQFKGCREERDRLRAEVATLRADKERLDWLSGILQGRDPELGATIGDIDLRGSWDGLIDIGVVAGNLRAAIDAASRSGSAGGEG